MQGKHRDSAWVDQWQEESELWNSHGLEGADKPCHWLLLLRCCVTGINRKNRGNLKYPALQSARRPVVHCDEIPVLIFGELPDISNEDASSVEGHEDEEEVVLEDDTPHPFSQKELNDLVREPSLSTDSAELLASRLKEKKPPLWQCLHQLLPQQASRVPPFFLYCEGFGVLCRYCAASVQAWSATVRTQILETIMTAKLLRY